MNKGYKLLFATMLCVLSANGVTAQEQLEIDGVKYTVSGDYATVGNNQGATGIIAVKDSIEVKDAETEELHKYAVKTVSAQAFMNCMGLTQVTLPVGITTIGSQAFLGSGLTAFVLPDSVVTIGERAFASCRSLGSLTVGTQNKVYDSRNGCNAIMVTAANTLVVGCSATVIPEGTVAIGANAFYGCTGLKELTIPAGVTAIGDNAFFQCTSLTDVYIPASVTSLGAAAFSGCTALSTIVCRTPAVLAATATTFEDTPKRVIVYVDKKLADQYQSNAAWSKMTIVGYVPGDANYDQAVNVGDLMEDVNCVLNTPTKTLDTIGADATGDNLITSADVEAIATAVKSGQYAVAPTSLKPVADEKLAADNVEVMPGAAVTVPVTLTTTKSYTALQMDITLPQGITLSSVESGALLAGKSIERVQLNATTWRLLWYSATKEGLAAEGGGLLQLGLTKAADLMTNQTVTLGNVVLADATAATTMLENLNISIIQPEVKAIVVKTAEGVDLSVKPTALMATTCLVGDGDNAAVDAATAGVVTIPAETEGYKVTGIAAGAFSGCTAITSVVIPEGVATIGSKAFQGCTALASIKLPASIAEIAADAFDGCTALTVSLTLQQLPLVKGDVKLAITANTQTDITSITIPKNVVSIAPKLTSNCTQLTSIVVDPENSVYDSRLNSNTIVETATNTLIAGCKTSAMPNDIRAIGPWAFEGQPSISALTLSTNIQSIGEGAFYGCTGITAVTLEMETPPSITQNTFSSEVYQTATLTIQNTVSRTRIAGTPWEDFRKIVIVHPDPEDNTSPAIFVVGEDVKTCQVGNGEEACISTSYTDKVIIQSTYDGYPVTAIAANAFLGCDKIPSIVIPEGVTTIGSAAFKGCTGLTSVNLPTTLTSIARDAFEGCPSLTVSGSLRQVDLVYGNVKIAITGNNVLDITSLNIPSVVVSIAPGITSNCARLSTITVETANAVYDSRSDCNAIIVTASNTLLAGCRTTVIPNGVTAIAARAFEGHTLLSTVSLPASVTQIGEAAFSGCTGIATVTINSNIPPTITSTTFSEETYKKATLMLPNPLVRTRIAGTPWENFATIKVVEEETPVETLVTYAVISEEAKTCQVGDGKVASVSITTEGTVTIPAQNAGYKVTTIAPFAFQNCVKVTSVVIPEGVTTIGNAAFQGCTALTSITLPSSVTTIAADAFSGCSNLTIKASLQQSQLIKDDVKVAVTHTTVTNMAAVVITRQTISLADRLLANCANVSSIVVESGNPVYDSHNTCNAVIVKATNTLLFGCATTVIPADVTAIAPWAFAGHTGLKTVTLLATINSIGEGAFNGCTGLTKVTLKATTPPAIAENTFSAATYAQATLVIPEGTTARLTGTNWARFNNIEEDMSNSQAALATAKAELEKELNDLLQLYQETSLLYNEDYDTYLLTYTEISQTANAIVEECPTVRLSIASSGYSSTQKQSLNEELISIQESSENVARQAFEKQMSASDIKTAATKALNDYFTAEVSIKDALKSAKQASDLTAARQLLNKTMEALQTAKQSLSSLSDLSDAQVMKAANQGNRLRLEALKTQVSQGPKPVKVGDIVNSGDYYYTVLPNLCLSIGALNKTISPSFKPSDIIVYGENQYTITEIAAEGFADCNNLQWVQLSDGVLTIREGAFRNCQKLTSIDLTKNLRNIERYALAFPNLQSIYLPATNTYFKKIDNHLYTADEKQLVRFLPIYGGEFTIPAQVSEILGGAFVGATKLTAIIADKRTPQQLSDEDAFDGLDFTKCKLMVPNGSGDLYRAAKGWNKFLIIEEYHGEDDAPVVITARSYTREYGDPNPDFGFDSEGATLDGQPLITCSAKIDDKPGEYPIIIQKGTVKNYNDSYVSGKLTITKAMLKVSVADAERNQGEENPKFEIVYQGFKLNDTPESLMMAPIAVTAAKKDSPAGIYTIAVSGGMDLNYNFTYTPGLLTVHESNGISDLTVEQEFDIYTTTGLLVKRGATSLKGIRPGIYIVNGRKVAVK